MAPRKRVRDEMESSQAPKDTSLLNEIRNMWEFACVMQYIFTFGKVVKVDEDFDIEDFELECLSPQPSNKLEEIGLTLLKWISSHRGLTLENWDEYTRRQYIAKSPHLNPYGTDEEPGKFRNFDIFQKIRVLHQMTVWTFWNPDRLRERMTESKEVDQTLWRVEELGWDGEERSYFVLDDSRLYRRTEPPLPAAPKAKPKSNSLKAQAARRRASKRRRLNASDVPDIKDEDQSMADEPSMDAEPRKGGHIDTFGGYKWECIAVTSQEYQGFLENVKNSRDSNEQELCRRIIAQVLPVVEKSEESQRRKTERRQKELMNAHRLTTAKRSSRLADKFERERQEHEAVEAAEKHVAELAAAHKEQERQMKLDEERKSRMMTREQRVKEREYKRLLHEEELAEIAEEARRVETGEARGSERYLKAQMEKHKRDLEKLSAAEEWVFDCSRCGVYGKNMDDGAHSVACESCNVWQHSSCLGIRRTEAEKEDFHFICEECRQRRDDAKRPNIKLKFRAGASTSPPQIKASPSVGKPVSTVAFEAAELPAAQPQTAKPTGQNQASNGLPTSARKGDSAWRPSTNSQHGNSSRPDSHPAASNMPRGPQSDYNPAVVNGIQTHQLSTHELLPEQVYQHPELSIESKGPEMHPQDGQQSESRVMRDSQQPSTHRAEPSVSPPKMVPHSNIDFSSEAQLIPQQTPRGTVAPPSPHALGRLPSPVFNRPSMSPTQGNPDVGPVAGVPHHASVRASISPRPLPSSASPHENQVDVIYTNGASAVTKNAYPYTTMNSGQVQPQHLSGLSPTKHSPIQAPTANSPALPASPPTANQQPQAKDASAPQVSTSVTTPHGRHVYLPGVGATGNGNATGARTVSGTPIFPPAETLQPSPEQMIKIPVPTPSKGMGVGVVPGRRNSGGGEGGQI